jgi:ABC-type taurine transport system ATPase subunit
MLTKIKIRGFKRLQDVELELESLAPVVLVGPNNSGKTSALQALALWSVGVKKWMERRETGRATKRAGVSINKRELVSIALPNSRSLWNELRVRKANDPIQIQITLGGVYQGESWECGMEFESVDSENIRCRPILPLNQEEKKYTIPEGAKKIRVAFLPPMSGLTSQEDLLQIGAIERRIGEGRTAEVLRNLCYQVAGEAENPSPKWIQLSKQIESLFGLRLQRPQYYQENGTLSLAYEENGVELDLTASGQGFRQTLLLLAYLYANPQTILLLDEPDAHLEILRQRQIYTLLVQATQEQASQLFIATHSEVILDEAAQKHTIVAFIGQPHIVKKTDQIRKSLVDYPFDHYIQAQQMAWVLYLEGATDLRILQALAQQLQHPAEKFLVRPFVHYVSNQPAKALEHFYAMREAYPSLKGLALFDHLDKNLAQVPHLNFSMWARREIENYIALPEALLAYVDGPNDLFSWVDAQERHVLMARLIDDYIPPIARHQPEHSWWQNTKMSDDFLGPVLQEFAKKLKLPLSLADKGDYYQLVQHLPPDLIAPEVREKLDLILEVAQAAESGGPHVG